MAFHLPPGTDRPQAAHGLGLPVVELGYGPDQAQKRLGDGLYEQRLVREAIMARTGQRYLAGLTSDETTSDPVLPRRNPDPESTDCQGELAINAVGGLQIDIKHIDQHTVSQTIDAMVQADPNLAWLKEMEQRGDVDWQRVKEVHDSFSYSSSGLGAGAQLVIAIAIAAVVGPAASGLAGGGAMEAAAGAAASGAASTAAISTINNRGDLGAVLSDVTSSNSLKNYAVAGATAGLTVGVYDGWTGTQTAASNTGVASGNTGVLANTGNVTGAGLNSWSGVGRFATN